MGVHLFNDKNLITTLPPRALKSDKNKSDN